MKIDNSTFVDIWRKAESVHEVAKETGLEYNSVLAKVKRLRKLGYSLETMREQRTKALDAKFNSGHSDNL